jgi:hypothetical protein
VDQFLGQVTALCNYHSRQKSLMIIDSARNRLVPLDQYTEGKTVVMSGSQVMDRYRGVQIREFEWGHKYFSNTVCAL